MKTLAYLESPSLSTSSSRLASGVASEVTAAFAGNTVELLASITSSANSDISKCRVKKKLLSLVCINRELFWHWNNRQITIKKLTVIRWTIICTSPRTTDQLQNVSKKFIRNNNWSKLNAQLSLLGENPSVQLKNIAKSSSHNGIVTHNSDYKSRQFIFVLRCTSSKGSVKVHLWWKQTWMNKCMEHKNGNVTEVTGISAP